MLGVGSVTQAKIACGRCRMVRTEPEWAALPAVTQVAGAELADLVVRWPDRVVVVVRACTCGAPIARLAPQSAPADSTAGT
jgi:hypothetical protein